jgi:hypothetical protein
MAAQPIPNDTKIRRLALGLLPIVLLIVVFLAAIPWLGTTTGGPMVSLIGAAVAILAMSYGTYFSIHSQRALDEVEKASEGFAVKWGGHAGRTAFVLLLLMPPFQDVMTAVVNEVAGDPGRSVDRTVVVFAMTLGVCGVAFLQIIGTLVASVIWWKSKQ